RILLPLQESRRQRRLIAAEAGTYLGSADLAKVGLPVDRWIDDFTDVGCVMLTHPHTRADAKKLSVIAQGRRCYMEILFADSAITDETWRIRSFDGPDVHCDLPAPPAPWLDEWLAPDD